MKLISYLLLLYCLFALPAYPQIGIGGQPHPSAVLDLKSPANDKAFYPPRLTTAQRKAIANPQVGAFVYDLDQSTFYVCDGQNWLPLVPTTPDNIAPIDRIASDGAAFDDFGSSVAISGDYAIIGASYKTIGSNGYQGAAYVFVRSGGTWIEQARLTANDGAATNRFGISVAISGDYAIVGASGKTIGSNSGQGAAYVFVRNGSNWIQQAQLTANDGAAGDSFGTSVAISGDYVLIGASGDNVASYANLGAAYVFVQSGGIWTQQAKLAADDGAANDDFGTSVAISGDYAIVGAYSNGFFGAVNQGSAYVFVRNGSNWTQQTKLSHNGAADDFFGGSVAISGNYAIVGAYGKTVGSNSDQGAAYVFVRSGTNWTYQAQLTASDGAAGDYFGTSVAISGDYVLVGAYKKRVGGTIGQGAVYIFKRNGTTWPQLRAVTDKSPAYTGNGVGVGLSNGSYIIGGPGFDNGKGKVSFGILDN